MSLFPELDDARFEGLKPRLDALGAQPPQVLCLDGGSEAQRVEAARYWAARVNCPQARESGTPCLACPSCQQIAASEHLDVLAFDGRISNRQDEEEPGPVRALTVDNVRELKSRVKDPPHGDGMRVVFLAGIEGSRAGAANALLKTLEEPSKSTLFVLMAPQREQLLPTLVSRSHCVTLPWPDPEAEPGGEDYQELSESVAEFLRTGRGLLQKVAAKSFKEEQALSILLVLDKALLRVMAGRAREKGVDAELGRLTPERMAGVSAWMGEARGMLAGQVGATRVMESLLMKLYVMTHGGQA